MKRSIFKKSGLLIFAFVFGCTSDVAVSQIVTEYPVLESSLTIKRPGYSLAYDYRTRNAACVHEKLTAQSLEKRVERTNHIFIEDSSIPRLFRSTLEDFRLSGFDRGHLAAAANHRNSHQAILDTFFLSNISPQHPQFNRGYWAALERHIRSLVAQHGEIDVFTGILFLPEEDESGKKWVKYQVIGENDVAVPTHFFKVLVLKKNDGASEVEAYILPNTPIPSDKKLADFKTTAEKVQKAAGVKFLH